MTGVWALAAPRECGDVFDERKRAQHSHLSSPGLTGATQYSRGADDGIERLRRTGSSGQAGR